MFTALINNLALLLSLTLIYSVLTRRFKRETLLWKCINGLVFGLVSVAGIMTPLYFDEGIVFDGRSIIIAMSGLFGGGISAAFSAILAAIFRMSIGGAGTGMGVLVILCSALWGSAYHAIVKRHPQALNPLFIYIFGLLVHINMMLLTVTLPQPQALKVLATMTLPVLVLFPLGTLFLGIMLHEQDLRRHIEENIKDSEGKLRAFFDSKIIGMLLGDIYGTIHYANDELLRMIGYAREDLKNGRLRWDTLTPPEFLPLDEKKIKEAQANNGCIPYEKQYLHKDGHRIWVQIGFILYGNLKENSVAFVLDISERKTAQEELTRKKAALQQTNIKLKKLYEYLNEVREEERERIAQNLHDELGQSLTALRIDTSWLDRNRMNGDTSCQEKIKSMTTLIDSMITAIQQISSDQRPGNKRSRNLRPQLFGDYRYTGTH